MKGLCKAEDNPNNNVYLQHDTSARIMEKSYRRKNPNVRKNCTDISAQTRISEITKFPWPDDPFQYHWRPWWGAIITQF